MKKTAFLAGATLLITSVLAGCSSSAPASTAQPTADPGTTAKNPDASQAAAVDQVMHMNSTEPKTLDPGLSSDIASGIFIRAVYDGLVRLDKDGQPQNSVASAINISDDKKTYTFTLRDSQWSNGDPVTAGDFVFSAIRTLDPKTGSGSAYKYFPIKNAKEFNAGKAKAEDVGIKAIDAKTLQVTLENPTAFFLTLATFYYPVNQKVVEANKDWALKADTIVSNGPFKMTTWEHKSKIVLQKNDTYWDKETVKLKELDFSMVEDANTELEMFNAGELDWAGAPVGGLPVDAITPLKDEGKLSTAPKASNYYLLFQTEVKPFTNEKIRKAFALAVNRQEIVDQITQAGQKPLMGFVPQSASLKPEGFHKDNDVQEAKQLLAEGMKELGLSKLPEITYLYWNSDRSKKIAEALQAQWKKSLDIDVTLVNKEMNVVWDDQAQGKYMISISGWTGDYNDGVNFLQLLIDKMSSNNCTFWHSDRYSQLIAQSDAEPDPTKRNAMLLEAETILMNEMPVTGLFSDVNAWVQSEKVKGVQIDALGYIDFKWGYKE
ncbi:peptide ABC transporter substrate-binding protein [Brevibacillus fluminis]|uniref:Peptide ABC transporter substrate-binding protein n=1 Tax=Brevibacillus fluminis TaxID=511487 RepID=A0A3M8DGC0_9BACL|nr:peptide ABC transporter substrate-binding protein [Brevibacillus fluminis]RNB87048.1 peptide ABC transporter substrate-binding protein [Brevibacillus fluminis]